MKKKNIKQKNVPEIIGYHQNLGNPIYSNETIMKVLIDCFINLRPNQKTGEDTPYFAEIARMHGLLPDTVRRWWVRRDKWVEKLSEAMQFRFLVIADKALLQRDKAVDLIMNRVNSGDISNRDLIEFAKNSFNQSRVASGLSTQNVANKHDVTVKYEQVVPSAYTK